MSINVHVRFFICIRLIKSTLYIYVFIHHFFECNFAYNFTFVAEQNNTKNENPEAKNKPVKAVRPVKAPKPVLVNILFYFISI